MKIFVIEEKIQFEEGNVYIAAASNQEEAVRVSNAGKIWDITSIKQICSASEHTQAHLLWTNALAAMG